LLEGYTGHISKLRFEILEVYPGTKYQDTVISEIYFNALRTITPSNIFKVPNISHATYNSGEYDNDDNELYWDLHIGPLSCTGKSVVASSYLSSQGSSSYRASNINDCNHETAWVEGVKGYGIGEWIEFQDISADGTITAINILNGYVKNDKAWSENARVKRLKVYYNGRPFCILELQNSRSLQTFRLQWAGDCSYINRLRFEILEVYPGTKYQDTVISEIYFTAVP
jgi:hypothetical protein